MTTYIGTSGWQYRHWREVFYPRGLPQKLWLQHYSASYQIVEVNATFYNLPEKRTFEKWREQTPPDFRFALKMSRYLTHLKGLQEPEEPVKRFLDRAGVLEEKLGPLLLQLPLDMEMDTGRMESVLALFPKGCKVAVEFRNASWFTGENMSLLRRYGAAVCLADSDSKPRTPLWRTAPWGYVRLHGGASNPKLAYSRKDMQAWATRITSLWDWGSDVYAFFNNDVRGCALRDARQLAFSLKQAGFPTSRVPDNLQASFVR